MDVGNTNMLHYSIIIIDSYGDLFHFTPTAKDRKTLFQWKSIITVFHYLYLQMPPRMMGSFSSWHTIGEKITLVQLIWLDGAVPKLCFSWANFLDVGLTNPQL